MRKFISTWMLFTTLHFCQAQTAPLETPKYVTTIEGVKEYSLSNGMQILLIPDATQSNLVTNIIYKVGSRHEGYGEKGMAHLLEHMLFKSTKKLGDIKKMLSDKGGNANGTTWLDRTNYFEIFPSTDENLKWSLEMEADRMINATMLQSDLDKEFSVVRNEFEIGENSPDRVLQERIVSAAYLWHNYGNSTIGSKEDIERVKTDKLKVFYERFYQPDNATLVIGGKFDEKKALEYIAQNFSAIPRPKRVLDKTYTTEPAQDGERFVELKRTGDVQHLGALYHTAALVDKDEAALEALSEILTNNPSGYFYKSLVESKVGSTIWGWQPGLHDPAFLYFGFEVPKTKSITEAKTIFIAELDKIATLPYNQKDLDRAKSSLLKEIENVGNSTSRFTINFAEIVGAGDYKLWFIHRDQVEQLTLADIERVAKKYFKSSNRTWGVFYPSANEERVKPNEFMEEDISKLTKDYKGKKTVDQTVSFDANIPNIIKNRIEKKAPNGFHYALINKPIKGNKVVGTFRIYAGDEKTLKGKAAIASTMAELLLSGTQTLTKEQIKDKLESTKTDLRIWWSGQNLNISLNTYQTAFPEMMNLIKDCITNSTFPEKELAQKLIETKTNLENAEHDPQSLVFTNLDNKMNPYPKDHIFYTATAKEEIEGLSKITAAEITDFFKKYIGGNNGVGTVISTLNESEVSKLVESTFGTSKSQIPYQKVNRTLFESKAGNENILTPDKENGAMAGGINLKMNKSNADYPALMMANEMLGSGGFMTSRIPTRLREKEGISYGTGSYLNVSYENEEATLGVYAFYNPKSKDKVDVALKDEFQKAITTGFTADELKGSIGSWQNDRKTSLGRDNFIGMLSNNQLMWGEKLEDFDTLETNVKKLTADQINSVFKKYISLDKLMTIYAGDFNKK